MQYWPAYNLLIALEAISMDVYAHVTREMQADAALLELPPYVPPAHRLELRTL